MKIFPSSSIKKLDAYTIEHESIASIDLMERTAQVLAKVITERWDITTPITIFAGPGNSGGDAFTVTRMLAEGEYKVEAYLLNPKGELSIDCQTNKELAKMMDNAKFSEVSTQFVPPTLTVDHLVVNRLFGSGLSKPLSDGFATVMEYTNASPTIVVAIDIPPGLMREENTLNVKANIIRAHLTPSLQLSKLVFLFAENVEFVGEWKLLDINLSHKVVEETESSCALLEAEEVHALIKSRSPLSHRGDFGHALLIAGSYGMAGASALAAHACMRSGVGSLVVHALIRGNGIPQISVPEAIIELDASDSCFAFPTDIDDCQVVGIGPGTGCSEEAGAALLEQPSGCQTLLVLDIDALSILVNHRHASTTSLEGSILIPRPKGLERIVGKCQSSHEQLMKACKLARIAKIRIILEGAYSAVIAPSGRYYFNSIGSPGMVTTGSGDVLTGVLLALLTQGYPAEEVAKIGIYIHGLASDFTCKKQGAIGMTAGDTIGYLPMARCLVSE